MKKIFSIILAVLMLVTMFPLSVFAANTSGTMANGTYGDNLTWTLYNDGELVIDGIGKMDDFGNNTAPWHSYKNYIKKASINNGVTSIGNFAFYFCKNMIKINIPNSVSHIGDYVFCGCNSVIDFYIPESVKSIGKCAFSLNYKNITVALENSFYTSKDNCLIEKSTKTLLASRNIIPDDGSVTSIGPCAFWGSNELKDVIIPSYIVTIGESAFSECKNIETIYVSEQNPVYISINNCLIEKASNSLVLGCKNSVIPNNISSICESAFDNNCAEITSIIIPKSVTSIKYGAFYNCDNLNTVYYTGTEEQWNNINIDQGNEDLTTANIIFNFTGNCDNTLVMATSANFPPFEYVENGNYVGIDIEIAEKIAEKLGMTLEIKDVEFDSIIGGVQTGKFDIGMAAMTVTDERLQSVNFSSPYATEIQVVIVAEDSAISSLDDLKGDGSMKFGVQKNTTSDIYVSEEVENGGYGEENVVRYNTGAEAIQALKSCTVDAVIIDSEPAKSFVSADNTIRILDEEYCVENYAIAIAKENHELLTAVNNALAELKSDGTIDRILSKYSLPNQNDPERPYDGIDIKIYSSLPNLNVGKDQEIRFAVSLFEEGTQNESKNGYSVIIKDNAYIELTETYKSGKDQIFVFEGKKEGNTKVSFIENDTKIQKDLTIYVSNDCRYFRCESLNQPGARQIGSIYITDFSCSQNNDGTQNIKFNAYNTNYSYATAEVFDQNGTFLKSVALAPKTDGSGMEKVINSFKYVYVDITDHTTPWYKKEANSQHTYVDIGNLPENSTIRITSDGKKSNIVTLYTGIDLFLNIVMLASGIEINKDAQKASVNELVKNIVENMPENAIKALASELSTAMINASTKEAAENTYNIIFNIFSDIGISYKKILTEVLSKMGYGALDSIVTTLVPSWKIVTAVDDITAMGWELLSYSSFEYGSGEIKIYIANHGLENMLIENGISVSQNELFSKTTILDAYVVEDSDELKNVYCGAISGVVYNITLRDQGKEIQPNGSIDVRIPIPKDMVETKCVVYRLEPDGTKTEMLTRLDDGYLVFTTDHLSYYEVVSISFLSQGDLNGDGKITASDARAALRISAKLDTPTEEQFIAADVNGDKKITASDARIILRVAAKLQTF